MINNSNQPREYDAVLGGQAPPPLQGVILGGIEGVKQRLSSPVIEARVAAVSEALNYGETGLNLVIQALEDKFRQVRHTAARLLQEREEPQAKLVLQNYKFWRGFERLNGLPLPYGHATTFANRKVVEFDSLTRIIEPTRTAYALRVAYEWNQGSRQADTTIADKFESLLKAYRANEIQALVFGFCGYELYPVVNALVSARKQLKNLKALFIGDIDNSECQFSWIVLSNVSQILVAYPNLEVLKIRCSGWCGNDGLAFEPLQHNKLKALIVESGGLRREAINEICELELPSLEYLELWLGKEAYGGNSSIEDLMPIISGKRFPKLKYLGLRHSEYSIYIALALVESPLIEQLVELDLSMGDLGDDGAETLLNCPAVHQLDTLNVAQNYFSHEMVTRLKQLDIEVIIDNLNNRDWRYCTAGE